MLLADGTAPGPIAYPMTSSGAVQLVSQWSAYNGRFSFTPRAQALRAVCSCGWTGAEHKLDWDEIGEQDLAEGGDKAAEACLLDWDKHTNDVEKSTVPLPETVTDLLGQLAEEIEKLTKTSPLAALRAVRRLEVTATEVGYWAAHDARRDADPEQAAVALGLDEAAALELLARLGRWSPYA
ncbi:hypothetical protein ACFQ0T_21885 [Kitasatospora gansuensis]